MSKEDILKAQQQFLHTDQFTTIGILLDHTDCKILLDSGAAKSVMPKQYYLTNMSLYGLLSLVLKPKLLMVFGS